MTALPITASHALTEFDAYCYQMVNSAIRSGRGSIPTTAQPSLALPCQKALLAHLRNVLAKIDPTELQGPFKAGEQVIMADEQCHACKWPYSVPCLLTRCFCRMASPDCSFAEQADRQSTETKHAADSYHL